MRGESARRKRKGKRNQRLIFYLRTVDLLTIKGRGFNTASAFLFAHSPPSFYSVMLCAFCLFRWCPLHGHRLAAGLLSLVVFARPSLNLLLSLAATAASTGLLVFVSLCSFSWLPLRSCTAAPTAYFNFLYFLTRPKVAHLIIMDYAIDDKKRALLCRSRLLLSYIILGYYQTFHLCHPLLHTPSLESKDRVWFYVLQRPYTVIIITEYVFCRKSRLPCKGYMPILVRYVHGLCFFNPPTAHPQRVG